MNAVNQSTNSIESNTSTLKDDIARVAKEIRASMGHVVIESAPITERTEPNQVAIDVLKRSVERRQMAVEYAKDAVTAAKEAVRIATQALDLSIKHKNDDVRSLALIASASCVSIDWHELGEPCDADECGQCGDSIE